MHYRYRLANLPVLLMAGGKSRSYFREGITVLGDILPESYYPTSLMISTDYSPEEKFFEIVGSMKAFF